MISSLTEIAKQVHVQIFVASSFLSILVFFIVNLIGDRALAGVTACYAGIMLFLLFERQFVSDRFKEAEKTIIAGVKGRAHVTEFADAVMAVEYITRNASSCARIQNTRFRNLRQLPASGPTRKKLHAMDTSIVAATREGCEYQIVCDAAHADELEHYSPLYPIGSDDSAKGNLFAFVLTTNDLPILQMTVLTYKDGTREALVGWDMGGNKTPHMPVLLFRADDNAAVCNLFVEIFRLYQECGKPVTDSEMYRQLKQGRSA